MRLRVGHHRRGERGTQVVEFAVVLPLLVFLGMAIVEGANFVRVHQLINNAAREGARFSTLPEHKGGIADIEAAVRDYLTNNNLALTDGGGASLVTVTLDQAVPVLVGGITSMGSRCTVTYTYQLRVLPGLPGFTVADTVVLVGAAEFKNFY